MPIHEEKEEEHVVVNMPLLGDEEGLRRPSDFVDAGNGPRKMEDIVDAKSEEVSDFVLDRIAPVGIDKVHKDQDQLALAAAQWFQTQRGAQKVFYLPGDGVYFSKKNFARIPGKVTPIEFVVRNKTAWKDKETFTVRATPAGVENAHLQPWDKFGEIFAKWVYPYFKDGAKAVYYIPGQGLEFFYTR